MEQQEAVDDVELKHEPEVPVRPWGKGLKGADLKVAEHRELAQYSEDRRGWIAYVESIQQEVCRIAHDTHREELEVVRPDEGEGANILGSASILLLKTVGTEEDEDHDTIVPKEGEEL